MNEKDFRQLCVKTILEYVNSHIDKTKRAELKEEDIYFVWLCKTLQNNKALVSTTHVDGMYYELTYNGNKAELYLDAYRKFENKAIKVA